MIHFNVAKMSACARIFILICFIFTKVHMVHGKCEYNATSYCGDCGLVYTGEGRIVGGEETPANYYPWLAAVFYKDMFTCGGTIINELYVMTAGHCISGRSTFLLPNWLPYQRRANDLKVAVGVHDISAAKKGTLPLIEVEALVEHPYYETVILCGNTHNDIALMRLKRKIVFGDTIKPACLPQYDYGYSNREARVAGWGTLDEESLSLSDEVRDVHLDVLSDSQCRQKLGIIQTLFHFRPVSMICAYREGKDSCKGDSGGPLMYQVEEGRMEQIGIVSYGAGCAKLDSPGVYTRVSLYVSWIERHAGVYCPTPNRE